MFYVKDFFKTMNFQFVLLIISATHLCFVTGSSHHEEFPHPHVQLLNNHIFRIKGFLFGMLGMISVIVASFIVYQYIFKRLRGQRSMTLFSERGALLPTTSVEQPLFTSNGFSSFWPIKALRDLHGQFRTVHHEPVAIPFNDQRPIFKNKGSYDPWEYL